MRSGCEASIRGLRRFYMGRMRGRVRGLRRSYMGRIRERVRGLRRSYAGRIRERVCGLRRSYMGRIRERVCGLRRSYRGRIRERVRGLRRSYMQHIGRIAGSSIDAARPRHCRSAARREGGDCAERGICATAVARCCLNSAKSQHPPVRREPHLRPLTVANILYLVHRLPYPPNKGDKVRSYHLLKHLAAGHRVFLGTFIDDPDDEQHLDAVRQLCADVHVERLNPKVAKLRSLSGLLRGEALTLAYYRHTGLARWVQRIRREQRPDATVVFSSAMAQYGGAGTETPLLVDLVDVDSAKWTQYAGAHRWPLSWLYRREGRTLLAYERAVVERSVRSFLVTDAEVDLLRRLAPECAGKLEAVGNGVNADYFSPDHSFPSPYGASEVPIVFTGAMDYWPNVNAVTWFAAEAMPRLRAMRPNVKFYIVGMRPTPAVLALAGPGITVTGTVPDVRPYVAHAAVVVAPLRIARGIQNKVLEAMAMARPVVASAECASGIDAAAGTDFDVAADSEAYVARIDALLRDPTRAASVGAAGRARVLAHYDWDARLSRFDRWLQHGVATCEQRESDSQSSAVGHRMIKAGAPVSSGN